LVILNSSVSVSIINKYHKIDPLKILLSSKGEVVVEYQIELMLLVI